MAAMSEQSDVILTPNSYDDGDLKRELDRRLWGYPKLVDACPFSVLADVRRKNLEEREKILGSLPAIHSESAPDVSGGRPTEIPGGGDITRDWSLSHTPPYEDEAHANEDVNPDIHGVYTNEAENHPENDSEQSVTQSAQLSVGEIAADRHSVPYDTEHTQERWTSVEAVELDE